MTFNKVALQISVSDNTDGEPNFGELTNPVWTPADVFRQRVFVSVPGSVNYAAGVQLTNQAAASLLTIENQDTTDSVTVALAAGNVLTLGPGENTCFRPPAGVDTSTYKVYTGNVNNLATLTVLVWTAT